MAASVEDNLVVRIEASLRKFERQMENGRKAAVNAATGSEQAWARAGDKMAANANRAATGLGRLTNVSRQGRFVVQNTANQFGDMAVQLGAGTGAMKVMGLQLPQLFGGLATLGGPLGIIGPLLGTVAAIGFPVAAAMFAMGEEAATLGEKISEVEKALSALRSAQDLASLSAGDLVSQYGGLAKEAAAIFEINREIAAVKARNALDATARGVASELGVEGVFGLSPDDVRSMEASIERLNDKVIELNNLSLGRGEAAGYTAEQFVEVEARLDSAKDKLRSFEQLSRNVDDLAKALGVTEAAAVEVLAGFAQIGQAQGPRAQAQAMSDLAEYINGASDNLAKAQDEGKALYDQLLEAVVQALELAKVDVAGNIASGADEAARLKSELAAALALQNRMNLQDSKVYSGRGGDPRKVGNSDYQNELGYKPVEEIIAEYNRRNSKSRGGGKSKANDGLREAQRLFDSTRTEAERYAAELERIEELHRRFPQVVTSEVRDRAVEALRESMTVAGQMAQRMEKGFEDAFVSFVSGVGNAQDGVRSLIADLARLAAQAVWKWGGGLFGGGSAFGGLFGGGILANATGNAFSGGRVTPFATGGVVSAPTFFPMAGGQTGLMGEAGPEAIMPLARVGGKLGVRSAGGGGTSIVYSPTIDARGADAEAVARLEAALQRDRAEFRSNVVSTVRKAQKSMEL